MVKSRQEKVNSGGVSSTPPATSETEVSQNAITETDRSLRASMDQKEQSRNKDEGQKPKAIPAQGNSNRHQFLMTLQKMKLKLKVPHLNLNQASIPRTMVPGM